MWGEVGGSRFGSKGNLQQTTNNGTELHYCFLAHGLDENICSFDNQMATKTTEEIRRKKGGERKRRSDVDMNAYRLSN